MSKGNSSSQIRVHVKTNLHLKIKENGKRKLKFWRDKERVQKLKSKKNTKMKLTSSEQTLGKMNEGKNLNYYSLDIKDQCFCMSFKYHRNLIVWSYYQK